ncbi:MAG: winged helix-turn-helix transcriptional regulator [Cuniculiplasma sp.]
MDEDGRKIKKMEICMMDVDGEKLCIDPSLPILKLISKKYAMLILLSIYGNESRSNFNNIKEHIPFSSSTIISQRIHDLERGDVIEKISDKGRIFYVLSPFGKRLLEALKPFVKMMNLSHEK